MQLDLFVHGRDVVLRNDALAALKSRGAVAAEAALAALRMEYPGDRLLGPMTTLLGTLTAPAFPRFANHAEAAAALRRMDAEVALAAHEAFGAGEAKHWLAPLWRAFAASADRLAFDNDFPHLHVGALLLRSGDWTEAEARISGIDSWRRIPAPLAWMAEARFGQGGLERAWSLLAELAWIDAPSFGALARRLDSAPLQRLLDDFDAGFQPQAEAQLAWFPAWALVGEPGLAVPLRGGAELLTLERQGRHAELVAQRKQLRELQPALFARYMATR